MLYHIDVEIDYAALGEAKEVILKAEWARTQELIERGVAIGEWREANGRGVIAVWDCAGHDEVNEILRGIPLAPYLNKVEVTPLVDHPLWPRGRVRADP
jgi:muconolactone delta-isomerase